MYRLRILLKKKREALAKSLSFRLAKKTVPIMKNINFGGGYHANRIINRRNITSGVFDKGIDKHQEIIESRTESKET